MKNVSIICLLLVTLLSCDKDSSSKSSSSDGKSNNSGAEEIDVCKCRVKAKAVMAKGDEEMKKFEASEEGKACAELMKDIEAVKAAYDSCPEWKRSPERSIAGKGESASSNGLSAPKSNNIQVEEIDVCKCLAMAEKGDQFYLDTAGKSMGTAVDQLIQDMEAVIAYRESEEGKACAEAMKDEEVVKAAAEACPERKQDSVAGPEDIDLNPCSCVERVIDIINRVSSMEEMNTLDQVFMREIPECLNIMEIGDSQNYINRNCPDAESRIMKAGQSKVEELGLLDLE